MAVVVALLIEVGEDVMLGVVLVADVIDVIDVIDMVLVVDEADEVKDVLDVVLGVLLGTPVLKTIPQTLVLG